MNKQENFIKRAYEIVSELKIPLVDESVQDNVKFKSNNATVTVKFVFEEDESVIRGFLGLAEYFHTVVIKRRDKFYIPHDHKFFILESS
ncbi:MAG: hypothetical protein JSV23_08575 [Promethearchaeota archaeon]|nr:MAG: hypothetical protein JSV23_08575 [Candidatus Lokiarchaeota archaeon]